MNKIKYNKYKIVTIFNQRMPNLSNCIMRIRKKHSVQVGRVRGHEK